MTPTALSIVSTTFPEGSERNRALGIWSMTGGLGATAAWLIGGPLVDGPGWEWIFFINIPVGLSVVALSPVLLRESRAALTGRSYAPAGALTITGALVLLVYALVEAPDVGWGDAQTILLIAGSAVLLAAFALIESRHRAPLVPLRIFRSRTLVGANLVMVVFGALGFGMPFILTFYAQQVLGYWPSSSGSPRWCSRLRPRSDLLPVRPRPERSASGRSPRPAWRSWALGRSCSHRYLWAAATSATSSSGFSSSAPASVSPSSPPRSRGSRASLSTSQGSPPASATPPSRSALRSASASPPRSPSPAPRSTWPRTLVPIRSSC